MGCRGVHFALTKSEVAALLALNDHKSRVDLVCEDIEERLFDTPRAVETDKAWDAIHRCFNNGALTWDGGEYPLNHVILAGQVLTEEDDYIISLKTPRQVRDIAESITTITEADLRARYRTIGDDYDQGLSDDDEDYTWAWFQSLPKFFSDAAREGHWVIFTVEQ